MSFQLPEDYWNRKFIAYLHDPLDKVLKIQGHEERGSQFLKKYGLQAPNEKYWKRADGIASGFERGQVPSYSPNSNENGAVSFLEQPVLNHPTSDQGRLKIQGLETSESFSTKVNKELLEFIENQVGMKPGKGGYSDSFAGDETAFSMARFFYTHLVLRFRLAEENIGELGALWHRLPADSRFPDYSIWQHNSLCSALYSSMELGQGQETDLGLMVFSLTPVQEFISKARKLRDFWTGSILLSWLAFEGIRWVMENLGPDHILYPSLIDQPLVATYLQQNWKIGQEHEATFWKNHPKSIASFPNKFLFVVPKKHAETYGMEIKSQILSAWRNLKTDSFSFLQSKFKTEWSNESWINIQAILDRQIDHFWEMSWTCVSMLNREHFSEFQRLLPEAAYKQQMTLLQYFSKIIAEKGYRYKNSGTGILYSTSHALGQSALAARKNIRACSRQPETGQKCHLCGEFEVLHDFKYTDGVQAGVYKQKIDSFWKTLTGKFDSSEFKNNEKLCSICLFKRLAPYVFKNNDNHLLHPVFESYDRYPSTTELSLFEFYQRQGITDKDEKREIAQKLYEEKDVDPRTVICKGESCKLKPHDRYYAILLMDGDHIGRLVNGETIASTWGSVMHPQLKERLEQHDFDAAYHNNWQSIFNDKLKRSLTPALHAAISESLGDFSLYGVAPIVQQNSGTLIYAGGDDVCAVLPVKKALRAAQAISAYYNGFFKLITTNNHTYRTQVIGGSNEAWSPQPGKLSVNLGIGPGISISAGILVCHHKESLTQMISRAHTLLDMQAKQMAGRNACAIELRKRSGGSRYFVRKWDDQNIWSDFLELGHCIKGQKEDQAIVSSSLVYRLETMRSGIEAILKLEDHMMYLQDFIHAQLLRSGLGELTDAQNLAPKAARLVVEYDQQGRPHFRPEGLIIAGFLGQGEDHDTV